MSTSPTGDWNGTVDSNSVYSDDDGNDTLLAESLRNSLLPSLRITLCEEPPQCASAPTALPGFLSPSIAEFAPISASDMSSNDGSSLVPVLGMDNFALWRPAVEAWCMGHNLDGILDGSETKATLPETDREFLVRSKKVLGFLRIRMDAKNSNAILTPQNSKNPALLWEAILEHHASSKASNRSRILQRLVSVHCVSASGLQTYLDKVRQIHRDMEAIALEVDQDLLAQLMLMQLPEDLTHLRTTIWYTAD